MYPQLAWQLAQLYASAWQTSAPLLPLDEDDPLDPLLPLDEDEPPLDELAVSVHGPPSVELALLSQAYVVPLTHLEAPHAIASDTPLTETLQVHPPAAPELLEPFPFPPLSELDEHAPSKTPTSTPQVTSVTP
jgi:hypothetical protein